MYAVAAPFNGTNVSLASLGFTDVGLDDVWQKCGSYGPNNYTYHDANGNPVVDTDRFPNMSALPATAHSLGLTAGWYGNNCACSDHCTSAACFAGDVNAVIAYGFDSYKCVAVQLSPPHPSATPFLTLNRHPPALLSLPFRLQVRRMRAQGTISPAKGRALNQSSPLPPPFPPHR